MGFCSETGSATTSLQNNMDFKNNEKRIANLETSSYTEKKYKESKQWPKDKNRENVKKKLEKRDSTYKLETRKRNKKEKRKKKKQENLKKPQY